MNKSVLGLKVVSLVLAVASLTGTAEARDQGHRHDMRGNRCELIPPNDLHISRHELSGIDEKTFNAVIDLVEKVYKPIIKEKGGNLGKTGNLIVDRNWDDDTVNAFASRQGNDWHVAMFGGLARHPETTPDGFAMVICHEIGHHLGGAPRYGNNSDWASTEGQSDYWASLKCMRTVLAETDAWRAIRKMYKNRGEIDPTVDKACKESQGGTQQEYGVCVRSSVGGLALAKLLADLGGSSTPAYDTPDQTIVTRTQEGHPNAQCRLDTYFGGAICTADYKVDVNEDDPAVGACVKASARQYKNASSKRERVAMKLEALGARPACWYKQPASNKGAHNMSPLAFN